MDWGKLISYFYIKLCLFLLGTDVCISTLCFHMLTIRSDQGGSWNLFSNNNANKIYKLTLVFDDKYSFTANKGSKHPIYKTTNIYLFYFVTNKSVSTLDPPSLLTLRDVNIPHCWIQDFSHSQLRIFLYQRDP